MNLFDAGEVDYGVLSGEYIQQREGDDHLKKVDQTSTFFIKMNQERDGKPTALENVNMRRAIAQAIDRDSMVDGVLKNGSKVANYFVPSGIGKNLSTGQDYSEESGQNHLVYDVETAKDSFEKGK